MRIYTWSVSRDVGPAQKVVRLDKMSRGKNSRRRMCSPLCVLIHRTLWPYCRSREAASRVTSLRGGMTWLGTSFRTAFQASWVVSSLFTSIHSSMFSTRNSWRCSATSSARPTSLISSITSSGRNSGKVMLGQDAQRGILEHHPKSSVVVHWLVSELSCPAHPQRPRV